MIKKVIGLGLIAALLGSTALAVWFVRTFQNPRELPVSEAIFEIRPGSLVREIAEDLKAQGLISQSWIFLLGHKIYFRSESLKAGEYIFRPPLSTRSILETLTEGKILLHPLTIPEGLTRLETAALIASTGKVREEEFLRATVDITAIRDLDPTAEDLEGYIFPETYHFPKGSSAETIVTAMIVQFKSVFEEAWLTRARELGFSVRDVVILASLIESETSLPEERPLVSSVFHNRLRLGMKLDCDPTIIYVLKNEGTFKDRLRSRDLKLDSPYNTYLYPGLPPGPISNPGRESLKAALYPDSTDYIYFVSKNDGSHHFSPTFKEHQRAVNTYQRRKKPGSNLPD